MFLCIIYLFPTYLHITFKNHIDITAINIWINMFFFWIFHQLVFPAIFMNDSLGFYKFLLIIITYKQNKTSETRLSSGQGISDLKGFTMDDKPKRSKTRNFWSKRYFFWFFLYVRILCTILSTRLCSYRSDGVSAFESILDID